MNPSENLQDMKKVTLQIFKSIDIDGNGEINYQELMIAIEKIAQKLDFDMPDEDEVAQILEEFDENGDGVLQLDEFSNFVTELFDFTSISDPQSSPNNKSTQRRRSSIMNNRLFKQIRDQEIKFDSTLFLISQQQTRLSIKLDENLHKFAEDIKNMDIPEGVDKEEYFREKQREQAKKKESFVKYQKTKEIDQNILENEHQILRKDTFGSIYSSLNPGKSPKQSGYLSPSNTSHCESSIPNESTREQSKDCTQKSKGQVRAKTKTLTFTAAVQQQKPSNVQIRKEEFRKNQSQIANNGGSSRVKEKQKSLVLKDGGNKEGKEVEALYDKKKKSGVKDWVKKNYK